MRDPYEVLGVDRNCSKDDLKKKYRQLAKKYHPDLNPGDEEASEKLKEINEAYAILSNDDSRRKYDRYGEAAFSQGGPSYSNFDDIFSDVFNDFFGGGFSSTSSRRKREAPTKGANIEAEVTISFEDSYKGITREISVNRRETCDACQGSGMEPGSSKETCPDCHGTGKVSYQSQTIFGQFIETSECQTCHGTGEIIKEKCHKCHGSGFVKNRKKLKVKIPAGIENNSVISLKGEGHAGKNGGPSGDIYVVIRVKNHDFFIRDGNDIYFDMPISFGQAALGAELEIPSMEGTEKFEIPEGTQTGTRFKVKGKGMPDVHGNGKGDLVFKVKVITPTKLTEEQREKIRAFDDSMDLRPKEKKNIFERLRDALER